jgi:hypothetical protein
MNRKTRARTRNAIPYPNIGDPFSHFNYGPSAAISQSGWLIEAAADGGNR